MSVDNKVKSIKREQLKPFSNKGFQTKSSRSKIKGKWRNSEHMQFIECFRKHGTNWDKLEKSVPTRTSLQVRTHAQKFFEKITNNYKVDNPVEFYLKNLRNHQMDLDHNIEEQLQNPRVSIIQKQGGPRHNEAVPNKEQDEFTFLNDKPYKNHHKSLVDRKRTSQELIKSSNKPSDKHGSGSLSKPVKYFKDSSGNHHDASTGISSSYLCLNGGEILIKGNGIKTTAPCDIQSIRMLNGSEQTMICANQPVQITITPISQGQSANNSIIFNHNIGSFIPPSGSGMPEPDRRVMSSQSDSTNYQLIIGILENNYCLRDIRGMCGLSSECRVSSLTSSGLNPNNRESVSYPSSSPFRVGQQESKPSNSNTRNNRKSNSEPMAYTRTNNNFFKSVDFQGKNSEGEIASKGSSQLSG
ncbi:unnamed protein product [Moneuplotes crassus]|uniref:Uncharacterized protein n=1 Tax=Euplotes crassus TaxID=5936 RepID=A0AAD1X268_EUPCR|nr:unnamed protein product [Moneuplotes crassus]